MKTVTETAPRKQRNWGRTARSDIDWGIVASEWPRAGDKWKKIKRKVKRD
jgi:hypothetical protein